MSAQPSGPGPFVVVGRDIASRHPDLCVGPFDTAGDAQEFAGLLQRTTLAIYVVLPLHTPIEASL